MTLTVKPPSASKMALRTAIILFLFVVVFTGLLSGAYFWTLPTIQAAAGDEKMKLIDEVLPRSAYDNQLLADGFSVDASEALGLDAASTAYHARKNGVPSAVVLEAAAPDGYAGRIGLLIALAADGRVLGVRVTQHKETPGLGDYIEPKKGKDKAHPWIAQFDGLVPSVISPRDWKVKKDGGRVESVAGATVSPRAVTKAIRKAAVYVAENHDLFFASQNKAATEPKP